MVGDMVKQDKPFELNRLEFGFLTVIWDEWKKRNQNRLEHPRVKAFDERITKHWDDAYR
jgi:hypothetical protein